MPPRKGPPERDPAWRLSATDGQLRLHTDVAGRAARMGHRLTIAMESWHIGIDRKDGAPDSATLVVDVDALRVLDGEGGVTPLTAPEKTVARANALKTLDSKRFPTIEFHATTISATTGGYLLEGPLTIHGVTKQVEIDIAVDDAGQMSCTAEVSQRDFGVKPYSMALGAMKVADLVGVSFSARYPG